MDFVKNGMIMTKYLADGCEFKKEGNAFKLSSSVNDKYTPFVGETYGENVWDMISTSDITFGEKHDQMYSLLIDHFKSGNTIFNKEADILLKKDERIIFKTGNIVDLNEPKSVRVTNSAHYGTSHRRGSRSHGFGVSTSQGESHEVIKNVDHGEIIITNKRFIYSGEKKNVDVNISQITGVTPYNNGIKLQRKSKQKSEYFVGIDKFFFTYTFDNEEYFFKLNGQFVKAMIEGGLNKTPKKSKLHESAALLKAKKESLPSETPSPNAEVHLNYCPNCGVNVDADSNFCMQCGYKLK